MLVLYSLKKTVKFNGERRGGGASLPVKESKVDRQDADVHPTAPRFL
jgi:hypothetical protein